MSSGRNTFYRCDLVDHGKWGIEAQILEAPNDFRSGHRFTAIGSLSAREQAVRWAEAVRADYIAGHFAG
jgi:hypothetical protein